MIFRLLTSAYLPCSVLFFTLFTACSAPAYSPGVNPGVDNLVKRESRFSASLERTPNAISAKSESVPLSTTIGLRYERGLTDNFTLRSKLFFGSAINPENNTSGTAGVGLALEGMLRGKLGYRSDLLFLPRLQFVTSGFLSSETGAGGGLAVLFRHRLKQNLALYAGPAYYVGREPGTQIEFMDGMGGVTRSIKPSGRALGGHLGLSYNFSEMYDLGFEVSPLHQRDNYFERGAWVPGGQITFGIHVQGRTPAERQLRRERRRKGKKKSGEAG